LRNDNGVVYDKFDVEIEGSNRLEREHLLINKIKTTHPESARTSFQEVGREDS